MRFVIAVAVTLACSSAFAEKKSVHAKLLAAYDEPNTWKNSANFYLGARGGVAVPSGANNVAPSAGLEMGVAPDFGFGFGLHVLWMNHPPGVPALGIQEGQYGFGAMADVRFYIPTVEPLTLYPSLSAGFLGGRGLDGRNAVLPLIDPGVGAKVKLGDFYATFEFGFAGFTIPFVTLGFGYEGNRRRQRAEAWARDREEVAQDDGTEVDFTPPAKPVPPTAASPVEPTKPADPVSEVPATGREPTFVEYAAPTRKPLQPDSTSKPRVLKANLELTWRGVFLRNEGAFELHGCEVRLPSKKFGSFGPEHLIAAGESDNLRSGDFTADPREPDKYMEQGYALVKCKEVQGYIWWGNQAI